MMLETIRRFLCWPESKVEGKEYSGEEIVSNASMYTINPKQCGIYFLLSMDEIVYVGKTIDLRNRLKQHWDSDKVWNRYFFIRCSKEELTKLEAYYILKYRPKYNIAIPKDGGELA